ncbi:ATP-grasp fold amidoligase family protein [Schumannella luteola]
MSSAADVVVRMLPLSWARAIRFRYACGYWPSLDHPVGLNEKINWRIVRDRRPLWDWTCDKLAMKERVREIDPGVRVPRVLWQGEQLDDSAGQSLEGRWILKSNVGSGRVIVGEGRPDIPALRARIEGWHINRQRDVLGEWAYRFATPGFFFEEWIGDQKVPPADYKFFVFDGTVRFATVHTGRFHDHRASIYSRDWTRREARLPRAAVHESALEKPEHWDRMVQAAERIGAGFDFLRVDLFDSSEGVWFGETTPYPWSGLAPLLPREFELEAGSYWTLPDLSGPSSAAGVWDDGSHEF